MTPSDCLIERPHDTHYVLRQQCIAAWADCRERDMPRTISELGVMLAVHGQGAQEALGIQNGIVKLRAHCIALARLAPLAQLWSYDSCTPDAL